MRSDRSASGCSVSFFGLGRGFPFDEDQVAGLESGVELTHALIEIAFVTRLGLFQTDIGRLHQ